MRSRYSRSRCEIICDTKTFSLLQFPNSKKNSRAKEKKVLRLGISNVYTVTFFFRTLLVTLRTSYFEIRFSFLFERSGSLSSNFSSNFERFFKKIFYLSESIEIRF